MEFDTNNKIVKLCTQGMECEGQGNKKEALTLFQQAWNESTTDFEKFTSAHYLARHQESVADKLTWDETALALALKINDDTVFGAYPSLYLNIAKGYEDLSDFDTSKKNYELALSFTKYLPDNGYGNLIKGGIMNGIVRIETKK